MADIKSGTHRLPAGEVLTVLKSEIDAKVP